MGGGGGGVAVPFYPVQDCSPISEEYRLRKSSPFFEITWRGWTPAPVFKLIFLTIVYRYYRNREMLHKEAPRLDF